MYKDMAYVYDRLMYDVDYGKWADYIEGIFKMYDVKPSLVLDLGCGTGNFCMEMAGRGYDMIGIDISQEMLSCAGRKAADAGHDILYLNQDMVSFELYGTVDAVVCLMDSINYITDIKDIEKMLKLVNNYLNPGGLFIFDINTCYKLGTVLGNNVFHDIGDDVAYIWENTYDKRRRICKFDLTFFVKDGEYYKRYDEVHREKAYSIPELKKVLAAAGIKIMSIFNDLCYTQPHYKSKRIFFICKKQDDYCKPDNI